MSTKRVDFTGLSDDGVTWTLLATLYLRAWESRSEHSILRDHYAAEAVERIDYDFARLKKRVRPESNQYVVALRARQFDDWGAAFLAGHPDATVLHLGCGLDSRMLRLAPPPGVRWFDLDVPEVIDQRRRLYPEHDGYRLIGASVTDPGWLDEVPDDRPVLVIAEGLFPYLPGEEVRRLFQRITDRFGSGELLFDTAAPWLSRLVKASHWGISDGREIERWNPRLTCAEQVPYTKNRAMIPSRFYRGVYHVGNAFPALRIIFQHFRFTF